MSKISELKKKWMKNPKFREEYEALETEFSIVRMLIDARQKANLTQEEVAKRMKTRQNVIARLESGKANPSDVYREYWTPDSLILRINQ